MGTLKLLTYKPELRWSTVLQGHLSVILAACPGIEIIDFSEGIPDVDGDIVMNLGNHQYAGSDLDEMEVALRKCNFMIGICDDYTATLPTQFRRAVSGKKNILMSNVPDLMIHRGHLSSMSWVRRHYYVNWNKASWRPLPRKEPTEEGLFYYGMYRPNREKYFYKYFWQQYYKLHIAASNRAHEKYRGVAFNHVEYPRLDDVIEGAQRFASTLYLEDEKTHKMYHSPANRFYEMASAAVPMFIDVNCMNTFRTAGIRIDPIWIVSSPEDIYLRIQDPSTLDFIAKGQMEAWRTVDYRQELINEVAERLSSWT